MNSSNSNLNTEKKPKISMKNVILKALGLFLLLNLAFAIVVPLPALGKLSAYNRLFPGRPRLPYGDNPAKSYNLTIDNLDAMFASHEISGRPREDNEFRVIVIGDSATWGFLLNNNDTLTGAMNAAGAVMPDGRHLRFYNLGYPGMSLMKDLLILSYALKYDPDLIIWPVTLESFPYDKQLSLPLLQNNPVQVSALIRRENLNLNPPAARNVLPGWLARTIVGARKPLADLLRLQIYGLLWAATGIDQDIPADFIPRQDDLPPDLSFHDLQPPKLRESDLAFDILAAGFKKAGSVPILIVNEPMYISSGQNSQVRYNFYYPRWAYDDYRSLLAEKASRQGWRYLDLWDYVPGNEFTNTAVHMTPAGTALFGQKVLQKIVELPAN